MRKKPITKAYIRFKYLRSRTNLTKIEAIAWFGTTLLFFGPYMLGYGNIGFILNFFGIALLTPQVLKARQWNLVILNISSCIGYSLQIFNII